MSFYDDASWLLIPSGIEEDIVFAQKPTSGLGDLSYTRASDATYTDASGVVRRSPYNLLTFSGDFTNAIWTKGNVTFSSGLLTGSAGTSFKNIQQANTQNGQQVVYFDVQYVSHRFVQILLGTPAADTMFCNFDLLNKTVTSQQNGGVGTIQDFGSYLRISMTFTSTSKLSVFLALVDTSNAGRAASSASTGSVGLLRSQLNEGTSALDYFPTTNRQDVPRIDFRNADGTLSSCGRLLLEPQRTNSIRNSSMVGAVAGSPGTAPTNWATSNAGLTQTIVGIGNESGLPYIDLRFNGTATSIFFELRLETSTGIAASNAQVWTFASYLKFTSGSIPIGLGMYERTGAGSFITSGQATVSVTSTLQRFAFTRTLSGGATVGAVQPIIISTLTNGAAYDFTIRIAAPQMELGAYATTWVPTTTAAVTRLADTASKTGVSSLIGQTEGTIFLQTTFTALSANRDFIYLGDASNSFRIVGTAGNAIVAGVRTAGGSVNYVVSSVLPTGMYKIGFAYKSGDIALYINGTQIGVSTSTSMPVGTLSVINLGNPVFNARGIEEPVSQAALFPTRLTNDQLAQLTTL